MLNLNVEVIKYVITHSRESKSSLVFVWLVLMAPILISDPGSYFVWINTAALLVYDLLTLIYRRMPDEFFDQKTDLAIRNYIILANSFALYWGCLTAYILHQPGFKLVYFAAALVLAFSTIGGFILWLLSPRAGKLFMLSLFMPSVLVMLYSGSLASMFSAFFILFSVLFLLKQGDVRAKFFLDSMLNKMKFEEQAGLYKEISNKDPLTGINNRRYFDRHFTRLVEEAQEQQLRLCLLVADIDLFKTINDQHGHDAGDECLRAAAQLIKQEIRTPTDILCRYGGEEFVVLLSGADTSSTSAVAERICQAFRCSPVAYQGREIAMTISIGGATLVASEVSSSQLFKAADEALFEAKKAGRDQYILRELTSAPP